MSDLLAEVGEHPGNRVSWEHHIRLTSYLESKNLSATLVIMYII